MGTVTEGSRMNVLNFYKFETNSVIRMFNIS